MRLLYALKGLLGGLLDTPVPVFFLNTNEIMVWLPSPYSLRNTNGIMAEASMLLNPYSLQTRTELWFGHGCSSHRILLETQTESWAWILQSPYSLETRAKNYGFGMDAQHCILLGTQIRMR